MILTQPVPASVESCYPSIQFNPIQYLATSPPHPHLTSPHLIKQTVRGTNTKGKGDSVMAMVFLAGVGGGSVCYVTTSTTGISVLHFWKRVYTGGDIWSIRCAMGAGWVG